MRLLATGALHRRRALPVSHGSLTVVSPERRFVSEQSACVDVLSVGLDPKGPSSWFAVSTLLASEGLRIYTGHSGAAGDAVWLREVAVATGTGLPQAQSKWDRSPQGGTCGLSHRHWSFPASSVSPDVRPSILPSVNPSVCVSMRPSVWCPCICLSVCPCHRPSLRQFQFIYLKTTYSFFPFP